MRIVNYPNGIVGQFADDGEWLYKDFSKDSRLFEKVVSFGKNNEPWPVCSDVEKEQWEDEHKPEPEPTDVETANESLDE